MHGRYAWLADSPALIATGLDHLARLLAPRPPPCVWAPPDRGSELLADAAARRLGLPRAPWPKIGAPAPGLVVVYDLATLAAADARRLVDRRVDQVLFAHATPWTVDAPIAADVTTLLYQALVPPWGPAPWVDPATGEVATTPADPRSDAAIAATLAVAPPLPPDAQAPADEAGLAALAAEVWPLRPGPRGRQWAGGPVPSSRFR
jgi:hypothetical protein